MEALREIGEFFKVRGNFNPNFKPRFLFCLNLILSHVLSLFYSRHLIKQTIIDCFHHCDILVMSGGVSMGDKVSLSSTFLSILK